MNNQQKLKIEIKTAIHWNHYVFYFVLILDVAAIIPCLKHNTAARSTLMECTMKLYKGSSGRVKCVLPIVGKIKHKYVDLKIHVIHTCSYDSQIHVWVSDCSLAPNQQFVSCIMAGTG